MYRETQSDVSDVSPELKKKIKRAASGVFAHGGNSGQKPVQGERGRTNIFCPKGHVISIEITSVLYESSTGKLIRARCSNGEFLFEW